MFSDSSNSLRPNGVTIWVAHYNDVNRTTHNGCTKLSRHTNSTLEKKSSRRNSCLACINGSSGSHKAVHRVGRACYRQWLTAANDLDHGWIIFCCLSCAYLRHVHPIQLVYRSEICPMAVSRYRNRYTMDFRRCCKWAACKCSIRIAPSKCVNVSSTRFRRPQLEFRS